MPARFVYTQTHMLITLARSAEVVCRKLNYCGFSFSDQMVRKGHEFAMKSLAFQNDELFAWLRSDDLQLARQS